MSEARSGATSEAGRTRLFEDEAEALEFVRARGLQWVGSCVRYFDETDSTNTQARRLGRPPTPQDVQPDGTLVVAEYQTHGRGRLGRKWVCPARAGLLVSVLVGRSRLGTLAPQWLTAAGALAMAEAGSPVSGGKLLVPGGKLINSRSGSVLVEWPNDLVAAAQDEKRPRKLGGVLVEGENDSALLVLGVGLNVDTRPEEFPPEIAPAASSLFAEFGVAPDRREILARFLRGLEERLADAEKLPAELRERSATLGRELTVELTGELGGRRSPARAIGFDEEMRLVVELPGGRVHTVASSGMLVSC